MADKERRIYVEKVKLCMGNKIENNNFIKI